MAIFLRIFIKTLAIFASFTFILILITFSVNFFKNQDNNKFILFEGDKNSKNTIALVELNGLIIENSNQLSEFTNPIIISPTDVQDYLNNIKNISPSVIIFSINTPGGTVSASKNLYDIIKSYKKENNVEILFHTNQILASGGYWTSTSSDGIYASYGSIIGSIGVKGPDWFFYDKPKSISTGIFGNKIETEDGIKIFSSSSGKSKDIFNPFREPTNEEINHLQDMVNDIYDDFIRIVSKERKIEIDTIVNDIGALIYNSKKAINLNLIDEELNLNELINKIVKDRNFENYKVLKIINQRNSLLREIITSSLNKSKLNIKFECLVLRSSISAILSYQSAGC